MASGQAFVRSLRGVDCRSKNSSRQHCQYQGLCFSVLLGLGTGFEVPAAMMF